MSERIASSLSIALWELLMLPTGSRPYESVYTAFLAYVRKELVPTMFK